MMRWQLWDSHPWLSLGDVSKGNPIVNRCEIMTPGREPRLFTEMDAEVLDVRLEIISGKTRSRFF